MTQFNLSEWALKHRSFVVYCMLVTIAAGLMSYLRLGRNEDPAFTFRTMIVQAAWPGATLDDTLDQVTDRTPSLLRVRLDLKALDPGVLDRLGELFTRSPGRCRVSFELIQDDGSEATLDSSSAVRADRELVERVRELCGSDSVALVQ